jgi:hypothetical protein
MEDYMRFYAYTIIREHREKLPLSVQDMGGNERPITDGIFPIFLASGVGPWHPVGTGFFIGNPGIFVTARHVVMDSDGQFLPALAGAPLLFREKRVELRPFLQLAIHPRADVSVGILGTPVDGGRPSPNGRFVLTEEVPDDGSEVFTLAFPKSELVGSERAFAMSFTTAAAKGILQRHYPEYRDRVMLPARCYQTSLDLQSGSSGGPVAFGDGRVFGINSTGMDSDGQPVGYVSSIADILDLELHEIIPPDGKQREWVSIRDLASLGVVAFA